MATDIVLREVILSYPHLVTPWSGQANQEASYNCAFIFPKEFTQWSEIQECVNNATLNKFGAQPPSNLKLPWLNRYLQPSVVKEGQPYAGCYVINAKSDRKPELLDSNVEPLADMVAKSALFAGCIVNAYVNFYGYNTAGNVGVGTGLRKIQLVDNQSSKIIRLGGDEKAAGDVFQAIPGAPPATAPVPGGPQTPPSDVPW